MVYLHFPSNLTEEEIMLQAKYQKLKRKKKAATKQKTPRPEPERSPIKISKGPKMEARDAREVAKKLIKSGAISPIVKTPKRPENGGFKRPSRFRGLDRKMTEEKAVAGYQPFAASPADERDESKSPSVGPKVKNLYDSFVPQKPENRSNEFESEPIKMDTKPKHGNTIFVSGYKIDEDILQKTFSSHGLIVDISMEKEKNRGFITFKKSEIAEKVIAEMNGKIVNGSPIKVTLARRQMMSASFESESPGDWACIAETYNSKASYNDKRECVDYSDDFLWNDPLE